MLFLKIGGLKYLGSDNLGDYIQSLAAERFVPKIDKRFNRDELSKVNEVHKHIVIMNGWFSHSAETCFPISQSIIPFFFGFHITNMNNSSEYFSKPHILEQFKLYSPIGCRDYKTKCFFENHGIEAYVSKCLTLTFKKRLCVPENAVTIIVDAIHLPLPEEIVKNSITVSHTIPPYLPESLKFQYAKNMLKLYSSRAKKVITTRLHVALPCIAMGIPVVFLGNPNDERFSFLLDIGLKVNEVPREYEIKYISGFNPSKYESIRNSLKSLDWDPKPLNVESEKKEIIQNFRNNLTTYMGTQNFDQTNFFKKNQLPFVSVIIPTCSDKKSLSVCLRFLTKQDYDRRFYEIIIIDDGFDDDMRKFIEEMKKSHGVIIRCISQENKGFRLARARNLGAKYAEGTILIFIDQDIIVRPDFITNHVSAQERSDIVGGYTSRIKSFNMEPTLNGFEMTSDSNITFNSISTGQDYNRQELSGFTKKPIWSNIGGNNFSIKRLIYLNNSSNESFQSFGFEDMELMYRLFQQGHLMSLSKLCVARHICHNENQSRIIVNKNADSVEVCESFYSFYKLHPTQELRDILFRIPYCAIQKGNSKNSLKLVCEKLDSIKHYSWDKFKMNSDYCVNLDSDF